MAEDVPEWMRLLGGGAAEEFPESWNADPCEEVQPEVEPEHEEAQVELEHKVRHPPLSGFIEIDDCGDDEEQHEEPPALSSLRSVEFTSAFDDLPSEAPAEASQIRPPPRLQKSSKAAPTKPPPSVATASTSAPTKPVSSQAVAKVAQGAARTTQPPPSVAPASTSAPSKPVNSQAVAKAAQGALRTTQVGTSPAAGSTAPKEQSSAESSGPAQGPVKPGTYLSPKAAALQRKLAAKGAGKTAARREEVAAASADVLAKPAKPLSEAAAAIAAKVAKRTVEGEKQHLGKFSAAQVKGRLHMMCASKAAEAAGQGQEATAGSAAEFPPWRKPGKGACAVNASKGFNKGSKEKGKGKEEKGKGKGSKGEFGQGYKKGAGDAEPWTGSWGKGSKKGEEAVLDLKRSASFDLPASKVPRIDAKLSSKVDCEGRRYRLDMVVVNFANVGASYGKKCLKRDPDNLQTRKVGLLDWEGVRRCVTFLVAEQKLQVVGVINENFTASDNNSAQRRLLPDDIRKLCESIEETPRIPGAQHSSADDEMTIKCAYRRNCRFLDNDHYRDWKQQLRDDKIRRWLETHADFLQMRYYFDTGIGTFDLLEGNVPEVLLAPDKGVAPKKVTKEELWHAARH